MRLVTDTFAYCSERLPQWNPISISGYHMREAGCTAVQELAFTLCDAIAYVEAAQSAGQSIDEIGPHFSFFFNAHRDLFEEVAKFRAAQTAMGQDCTRSIWRNRAEGDDDALSHADGRFDADGPATAK